MIIHKAYKFRLYPTAAQKILLAKHFGSVRWVYNTFLAQRIELYEEWGQSISHFTQALQLRQFKKTEDLIWLKEIDANALIEASANLQAAYDRFFKTKKGYPKFKSKYDRHYSFTGYKQVIISGLDNASASQKKIVTQVFKRQPSNLRLVSLNKFREGMLMVQHQELIGEIKHYTVSSNPSGDYYISILCAEPQQAPLPKTSKVAGIDMGIRDFVILDDGTKYANAKWFENALKKLATAQRHLSRKQKGSKQYEGQRKKVAKLHQEVANIRNYHHHCLSLELIKQYDELYCETLGIADMLVDGKRKGALSRRIAGSAWGMFIEKLSYKAAWYGKTVKKADRYYPSSKKCSVCGHVNDFVDALKMAEWDCENCGTHHDIDVNAATNLRAELTKPEPPKAGKAKK